RLLEVKHLYKKVENQIKMAKMVLMNEIDKRTNILLEQLEKITSERKQRLEQQLQGVVLLGRQVEHVQNFISWAVCSKKTIPFLFSKELIVFQIQRLLETNCNTDTGPPLKIRFTWDPSYWTKQLSNLGGFTMEGGHVSHPDVLLCGSTQGLQPALFHGQPSPGAQPESSQPHQLPPALQGSAPLCCSHCLSIPHPGQAQPSYPDIRGFHPPPALPQQRFPLQYSLQQQDREPRAAPQPGKVPESASGRLGKPFPPQPLHQACAGGPHEAQQAHGIHPQASLQAAAGVQLGQLQKVKPSHALQPPPQVPLASPQPGHDDSPHKQVIQQSLDIMHHQLELEEMKKDLELLLQAQGQPSLQLNQAKPPQHVQQTIVGQINYIVRQPAPAQQHAPEE
ncbi:TRI66 protein, partial [Cercotrichas coryphoeus]|nr:TRI66 protein [Cercotrichas coryphoeus]